jgi:3-keto-5-aminohexanoate cleavage enzyme
MAVVMQGKVYHRKGEPVGSNARPVERTVRIARELIPAPATPDEARAILGVAKQR